MAAVKDRKAGAVWTMAFRPFFLAASIWSAGALGLWILILTTGWSLPSRFSPVDWHVHEMLFGFVPAAIAGFILTAIPNWTGRAPVRGRALAALLVLWLAGRAVCFTSAWFPAWLPVSVDSLFLLALCLVAARELVLAGNLRNLVMPIPIGVLLAANVLVHLEAAGAGVPDGLGRRLGISAIVVLITIIGGRIIPIFTRNWLSARGCPSLPPPAGRVDLLAILALICGLCAWTFFPELRLAGVLLLVAAALHLWRLARWRGLATAAEPLLAVLHAGYLWVGVGAGLLGASVLSPAVPQAAAIHALTAGAMGTMVLAVMSRVTLGHTGRPLHADGIASLAFVLITLAATSRLVAAFSAEHHTALLTISAMLWIASFLLFLVHFGPMLLSPRTDGH